MYEAMFAETVRFGGYQDDEIEAYFARPFGGGPYPAVIVLHHAPGWDEATKEITRKFAHHGYVAICPNLHFREGPGSPDDLAAAVRAAGGVPDDRCMGDIEGSMAYVRAQPYHNGKIGIIGFCSGGRQVFIAACRVKGLDAAVDCWGGRVIAKPEEITERQPVSPIELAPQMSAPLLGIFGNEDRSPDVEQVNAIDAELQRLDKPHEFHRYDGAGHGFFAVDRPAYRPQQAVDAWQKVFAWYEHYLS